MCYKKFSLIPVFLLFLVFGCSPLASSAEQPIAIFHAFDQHYNDVSDFVCTLAEQGYSHVQVAPAQKSNPQEPNHWFYRYQPVEFGKIEGRGSEIDLKNLVDKAGTCTPPVKIIADVVFNHMASAVEFDLVDFPEFSANDFRHNCSINFNDGNRDSEINCWLGGDLADLDHSQANVRTVQKNHLKKLIDLGVGGVRFDAAKHMSENVLREYIDFINAESSGNTWNYLEVIMDSDTSAEDYNGIAAVSDFILYNSMKDAFTFGGDLRTFIPREVPDPRSVTFGQNHDTIKKLNSLAINPYDDVTDAHLATAFVLARERGTPLVFNEDNLVPYIPAGVKFRRLMHDRSKEGKNVRENILRVVNSPTILIMERGNEGLFILNKATEKFDTRVLDMTLTNLDGCYQELRNNFTVHIERKGDKKFVSRWGTRDRGGMEIHGRDALYFMRVPIDECP